MMKITISSFVLAFAVLAGCQEKSNQERYDEVMAIHDEVMPKMNDIYRAKTGLRKKLEDPSLGEAEKKQINDKIAQLDSADKGMMEWMRQFDPIPDSLGEDKARQYLENELVKVKKVRENILEALARAQGPG